MQSDLASLQQCQDLLEHTRMLQFMEQYPAAGMCSSPGSHMDEDFFYSVVTVQAEKSDGSLYSMSDDICYYFVFTEYGVAVALHPGDVLLFNPFAVRISLCNDSGQSSK